MTTGDDNVDVSRAKLPDRSLSTELDDTETNTQTRGILVHRANQNSGPSRIPLREGVVSPWVSLLELIFIWLCQFLVL
jgi:hypothetical protein